MKTANKTPERNDRKVQLAERREAPMFWQACWWS